MSEHLAKDSAGTRIQWWIILSLFLFAGALGLAGYSTAYPPLAEVFSARWWGEVFDNLYRTMLLFTMNTTAEVTNFNPAVQVARFLAPIATFSALAKILIQAAYSRALLGRLRRGQRHIIVIGLGDLGQTIAGYYAGAGRKVVAIEQNPDEEDRAFCMANGITLIVADATQRRNLEDAAAGRAEHLFAVTPSDITNIEICVLATQMQRDNGKHQFTVHTHLSEPEINRQIQDYEVHFERLSGDLITINFFSSNALTARELLASHPLYEYADHAAQDRVHLVIAGFDDLGEAILIEAALVCHYRDLDRLRCTILDENARNRARDFITRYPQVGNFVDFTFIDADLTDGDAPVHIKAASKSQPITATVLCLDQETQNVALAMELNGLSRRGIINPGLLLVHKKSVGSGFVDMVAEENVRIMSQTMSPFGLGTSESLVRGIVGDSDALAKNIHAAYVNLHGDEKNTANEAESGDKLWNRLPETFRRANRRAADHVAVKLRSAGFRVPASHAGASCQIDDADFMKTPEERELLARLEHDRWSADRYVDGWKFGRSRDNLKKLHPQLKPFEELTREEKDKDAEQVLFLSKHVLGQNTSGAKTLKREAAIGLYVEDKFNNPGAVGEALKGIASQFPDRNFRLISSVRPGVEAAVTRQILEDLKRLDPGARLITLVPDANSREIGLADARHQDEKAYGLWQQSEWVIDLGPFHAHDPDAALAYLAERCELLLVFAEGQDAPAEKLARWRRDPASIPAKSSSLSERQRGLRSLHTDLCTS